MTEFHRTIVGGVSLPRLLIGTTTPDEARESIELSLDLLAHKIPDNPLQRTRSKASLE